MLLKIEIRPGNGVFAFSLGISAMAQSAVAPAQKVPTAPAHPFVVLPNQSLSDLERKLQPDTR